jgi:hypothetical protein
MERNVYRTIQQGRVVYISTTWDGAGTRVGYVTNKSSSCVSSSMPANIRLASHCLRDIRYVYERRTVYKVAAAMTATKPNQMFRVVQQNNPMMERL